MSNYNMHGEIVAPAIFRILSPETEIYWAGWQSHLSHLFAEGWAISMMEDHMRRMYRVYLKHDKWDCVGVGELDSMKMRGLLGRNTTHEPFRTHLKVGVKIGYNINIMDRFEPELTMAVDPRPQITEERIHSLRDARIFATIDMKPEHEILVREPTMQEILQMALDNQEPEQARIRAEMISRSKLKANLRMVV